MPRILAVLAGGIVVPATMLALGTFFPTVPYLGTVGSYLFPRFVGPFLVLALGGTVLALVGRWLGARRIGLVIAVLGTLAAASAAAVMIRHARIAAANGAAVNGFAALIPRSIDDGAPADATVTYARAGNQELKIDIYRPASAAGAPAAVAMYVHGGGWVEGDRSRQAANLRWFTDHGYIAVSPDYVLATPDRATWHTAGAEVACAMAWVAANISNYGGDPQRLFAFGESAGGALVLSTAYAAAVKTVTSSCGGTVPVMRAVAAQVPAVDPITFYGNPDALLGAWARRMVGQYLGGSPADHPERARAVSPATYITPHAPPTLIVLAEDDHLVPIGGALQFVDRAAQAGVPLQVVRFPWADHGIALQYYSIVNQTWLRLMVQHFCRHGGMCTDPNSERRTKNTRGSRRAVARFARATNSERRTAGL